MNLRRTMAISRRIVDLFRRDHRTLALVTIAPVLIMALLGWVIRDQGPPVTRLAVVNEAGAIAQQAVDLIERSAIDTGVIVVPGFGTADEARTGLADNALDVALVIEIEGLAPMVTAITPGVSPSADGGRLEELRAAIAGAFGPAGPALVHETIYGSADPDFLDSFSPALVGYLVFFLVFMLTGISFLRERIGGTLERLLATPVRRSEIVVGYSLGFGIFATIQVALILAFTLGSVHVPALGPLPEFNIGLGVASAGSPLAAFLVTLLLAISAVNLAIFLSTFARTELQIIQFIPIVIVPQGLLSGIFWPVESLPDILEPIARLLPVTYGIDGLREVLIKGSGLGDPALQLDLLVLSGIAVVLAALASLTIRRDVA